MNYKKLYSRLYDLRDHTHTIGDQKYFKKIDRVLQKVWSKFHSTQRISILGYDPEQCFTVEYESELIDDLDLFDDVELDEIQVEDDGRTIIA